MFERRTDERLDLYCYLISPATISDTKRAIYWGNQAAQHIAECEELIGKLKEYQTMIYKRVQEIESAPYHPELELTRYKSWSDKKVTYTLRVLRVYDVPGIEPQEEQKTVYPGAERRKAIAAYEAMKKARPGIVARLDIEKSKWER